MAGDVEELQAERERLLKEGQKIEVLAQSNPRLEESRSLFKQASAAVEEKEIEIEKIEVREKREKREESSLGCFSFLGKCNPFSKSDNQENPLLFGSQNTNSSRRF
jgi:hypothetical protein